MCRGVEFVSLFSIGKCEGLQSPDFAGFLHQQVQQAGANAEVHLAAAGVFAIQVEAD